MAHPSNLLAQIIKRPVLFCDRHHIAKSRFWRGSLAQGVEEVCHCQTSALTIPRAGKVNVIKGLDCGFRS
jgi:hypothetical protein